jgi:hypothetical protein
MPLFPTFQGFLFPGRNIQASLTSEGQQFFRLYQILPQKIRTAITLYREEALASTLDSSSIG